MRLLRQNGRNKYYSKIRRIGACFVHKLYKVKPSGFYMSQKAENLLNLALDATEAERENHWSWMSGIIRSIGNGI